MMPMLQATMGMIWVSAIAMIVGIGGCEIDPRPRGVTRLCFAMPFAPLTSSPKLRCALAFADRPGHDGSDSSGAEIQS
jgi:hypothetical protein